MHKDRPVSGSGLCELDNAQLYHIDKNTALLRPYNAAVSARHHSRNNLPQEKPTPARYADN